MKEILTLNKIAKCGTDRFDSAKYICTDNAEDPAAIMVRSASMHEMQFGAGLLAIARAGAGVNNIPIDRCSEQGIAVFNTPGANANAVKELVICAALLASRKVVDAIDWCKTLKGEGDNVGKLVEKGKSSFAGPEMKGKTMGVVGMGAIGNLGRGLLRGGLPAPAHPVQRQHEKYYKRGIYRQNERRRAYSQFRARRACELR